MIRKDFTEYTVYKVYSNKLKWFLLDRGFKYVDISEDKRGKYWLFIRSEQFNSALDEYKPM